MAKEWLENLAKGKGSGLRPEQERGTVYSPGAKRASLCCTRASARFRAGEGQREDFGPEALFSQQCGNWPGRGQGEQRGSNPGITRERMSVPGAGRAAREKL